MSKKMIIGLCLTLILLCGGLVFMKNMLGEESGISEPSSPEVSGEGVELIRKDPASLNKIEVSNAAGAFTVLRVKNAAEDDRNSFTIKGYENLALDDYMLYTLVNNVSELTSVSIVSDASDELEKYGLKNPEVTAELFYESGESVKFYVGDISPVGASIYFMLDGDDAVYTVSTSKMANYRSKADTFISKVIVPEPPAEEYPIVENVRIIREDLDYDIYIEYDEDGVPLGEWRWDPDLEEWIFDEYIPLANMPQTGISDGMQLVYGVLFFISCGSAVTLIISLRREKANRAKYLRRLRNNRNL